MTTMTRAARLAIAVLSLLAVAESAKIIVVYSISRHGARNVLPKSITLKEAADVGPSLLPQGQRQCYNAGVAFQQRYLNTSTCGATCLDGDLPGTLYGLTGSTGVGFDNLNTLVRSSHLDRTLVSAQSMLEGAFPAILNPSTSTFLPSGRQVIPIYNFAADQDDWLIRSYTKCPAYDSRLLQWFQSQEFQAMSASTANFRGILQQMYPSLDTSLQNMWNVYDPISVSYKYGIGTPFVAPSGLQLSTDFTGTTVTVNSTQAQVTSLLFNQLASLANWLETSKMRYNLVGNTISGPLLGDLYSALSNVVDMNNKGNTSFMRYYHLSGHYNVLIGLTGGLGADQYLTSAQFPWLTSLPATASMMAWELWADDTTSPISYAVRLVFQDGPAAAYATFPLRCAVAGDAAEAMAGAGSCTWQNFVTMIQPLAITEAGPWCDLCENNSTASCQLYWLSQQAQDAGDDGMKWKIAVSVCVTFAGTAVLTALVCFLLFRPRSNVPTVSVAAIAAAAEKNKSLEADAPEASNPATKYEVV